MKRKKGPPLESRDEIIKRWHEALQSAESLVERAFQNGQVNIMTRKELRTKLKQFSIDPDDVDNVIYEAQRAKLIFTVFPKKKGESVQYCWIAPDRREEEKAKTQYLLRVVEEVYTIRKADHLTEAELKEELKSRDLSDDDADRAIYEAERDYMLFHCLRYSKWGYSWIPPDDRKYEPERRRLDTWYFLKWLDKKARQGEL